MRNFSVSNVASDERMSGGEVNVGIAPGKFDTKQLILSAITVLSAEAQSKWVRFVRTINMAELSKCNLFVNDDFTTMFPVIPSYHDIEKTWNKNAQSILARYYVCDKEGIEFVSSAVVDKICNLEAIDCMMQLYDKNEENTFEDALNIILKFIDKFIADAVKGRMYMGTVEAYLEKAKSNYVEFPIYVQDWRHMLSLISNAEKIDYAVFPDEEGTYIVEAFDKNLCVKKYVKGLKGIVYSGRFFVRVNDLKIAETVISKLPAKRSVSEKTA